MKTSTQPYKGARDFYPEDKRIQKWMFDKWRQVLESYGYVEYDAPILEPTELFLMKGNQEIIDQQTYTFKDRGDRSVTVRTEMTPTVSRMVAARRQELSYPLRWYSIPNLWRYERMQRGRLREFWQLNADIFGVEGIEAELEMMQIIDSLFRAFGANEKMYEIRVNSKKLLEKRITAAGLKKDVEIAEVVRLIDKKDKMSVDNFYQKLSELVSDPSLLISFFEKDGATEDYKELAQRVEKLNIRNVVFVPTIARGFDYYTDIVFEVFDTNPENNRSMFGGGRYDGLVGMFGVDLVPTVGFGMGDVTFQNFLESNDLMPKLNNEVDVTVLGVGTVNFDSIQALANDLRKNRLNVSVDFTGRKLDRQLKSVDKNGIRYALIVGQEELLDERYLLKNLQTGNEEKLTLQQIVDSIAEKAE